MLSRKGRTALVLTATVWLVTNAGVATADELTGSGGWQSLSSDAIGGKWSVSLTRNGTSIDGTLTLAGSNVFTGGQVVGTMDASSIVLGVISEAGKQASFSGKVDGDAVSGEWESTAARDHGVWYGTLTKN